MEKFLQKFRANRFGYDGWAIALPSAGVLDWSVCTTRDECREVAREYVARFTSRDQLELFGPEALPKLVKVKISVEEVPDYSKANFDDEKQESMI